MHNHRHTRVGGYLSEEGEAIDDGFRFELIGSTIVDSCLRENDASYANHT